MKNPLADYDTCHKCGGVGVVLNSESDGEAWHYDYQCEDCEATWDITMEMTPINRDNHE